MALIIDNYLSSCLSDVGELRQTRSVFSFEGAITVQVPSGALRIGGDSPLGLVLVAGSPAARIVDVFTRDTVNDPPVLIHVMRTTSAGNGTYSLTGLAARAEGYDVCIRGVIASGERDYWIPGVHPG